MLSKADIKTTDGSTIVEHSARTRAEWVDVARGIGIVLVVWGHLLRGNLNLQTTEWAASQDRWIYSFHMPLFFMLSGLFVWRSIGKGSALFLKDRWWSVIWPYLLWSAVTGAIELAMSSYVNSPISVREFLSIPLHPIEQYWFLYALLVCQLVCVAAYPSVSRLVFLSLVGLIMLKLLGGAWIGLRAFLYLPFLVLGVWLAPRLNYLSQNLGLASLAALSAGGAILLIGSLWADGLIGASYPLFLTSGIAGSLAAIACAMILARTLSRGLLGSLGRASLAIFVLHTLISAGTRIALNGIGILPSSAISLAAGFLLGLFIPWMLFQFAQQRGHAQILGLGSR